MDGKAWMANMMTHLASVVREPAGDVQTASYLAVLAAVPPIYDQLFPAAVSGIMKGDITGGVATVREAMAAIPNGEGATLLGIVKHQISTLGPAACAAAKANATKSLLWLNRAATFISQLLRALAMGMDSDKAAYMAYSNVLKPYHGWMTEKIVGNAVSYGPAVSLAATRTPSLRCRC